MYVGIRYSFLKTINWSRKYIIYFVIIATVPVVLYQVFGFIYLVIPLTILISWVFIMMEMIGGFSENPFEGLHNDVPITTLARSIEIDIRQMIEETDLPEPVEAIDNGNIIM